MLQMRSVFVLSMRGWKGSRTISAHLTEDDAWKEAALLIPYETRQAYGIDDAHAEMFAKAWRHVTEGREEFIIEQVALKLNEEI